MFDEVQNLLGRVTGADSAAVAQAASDHVSTMDPSQVREHLQTAAGNAAQSGQSGIAQQIEGLLSQSGSNPQDLKQKAISLITANPQILEHFAPGFAKGILGKL